MVHVSFKNMYLWNQFTLGIYSIGHLRLTVVNKTRTKKCIHSIKLQLEVSFFFALILWMHNEFKSRIQFGNWFEKKTRPGLYFALSLSFSISIMYSSFRKINFRYLKVIKMWQWTYYQVEMIKELKILNYAWNCYGITFWFRFVTVKVSKF
mgnify:CR=1 FL=1